MVPLSELRYIYKSFHNVPHLGVCFSRDVILWCYSFHRLIQCDDGSFQCDLFVTLNWGLFIGGEEYCAIDNIVIKEHFIRIYMNHFKYFPLSYAGYTIEKQMWYLTITCLISSWSSSSYSFHDFFKRKLSNIIRFNVRCYVF